MIVNGGLLALNKWQRKIRDTGIMAKDDYAYKLHSHNYIFNRYVKNPELVFSPLNNQTVPFDHAYTSRWHLANQDCFQTNLHKYVHVYFNQHDPSKNTFTRLENQGHLISELERRYPVRPAYLDSELCPLIFVNGKIYSMMSPTLYFALLCIDKLFCEKARQARRSHSGTLELVGHAVASPRTTEQIKVLGDALRDAKHRLGEMAKETVQKAVCEMASKRLTFS